MRTRLLGAVVLVLSIFAVTGRDSAETVSGPRGELRIVDRGGLTWGFITFNVFEHLVRIDRDGQLVPELATNWQWLDDRTLEVKLREGVKFQNGEVFDAESVKINVEETKKLRHPFHLGTYFNFKPGSRVEIGRAHV